MSKELKFISPLYNTTFKYLWKEDKCKKWLSRLIYLITNVDLSEYYPYDQELNSGNDFKDYRLDILFVKDIQNFKDSDAINIEMYKKYNESDAFKSHAYIFRLLGFSYDKGSAYKNKKVIQVNFNDGEFKYDKDISLLCYQLKDKNTDYYLDDLKIYDVFLNKYKGICYNGANELDAMLSLISASSYDKMREIANGNKEALRIVEELEKLAVDEEFYGVYNNEKVQRKLQNTAKQIGYEEGLEQGKIEEKLEIAKNLLKMNLPLEQISEVTGVNLEDIEKMYKEL